ncbi:MAG: hypothetical protein WBC71_08955, partial [Salaquimonas sp.]
ATDLEAGALLSSLSLPQIFAGSASVNLTIDGTGKSSKALIGSLAGSGVATMPEGQMIGVNVAGLPEILEAVDVEGFEINSNSVSPLAKSTVLKGDMKLSDVSAPFSISKGTLQFRSIELLSGGEKGSNKVTGDMTYGLLSNEIETGMNVSIDPGSEEIAGGRPEVTFVWKGNAVAGSSTLDLATDTAALEGFLSIRAFEIEQRRVESLQASILEKQRFRYELLRSNERSRWLEAKMEAEKRVAEEAEKARMEAERARLAAEAERARLAAEAAAAAELAAKAAAEEAERLVAEKEAKRQAELQAQQDAILRAELEAQKKAEEARRAEEETQKAPQSPVPTELPKSGFEVKGLPAPQAKPQSEVFKNIEELLFQNN